MRGLACRRALVCLAETDVVRDRGRAYCDGLKASGWAGEVELLEVAGQGHCFHLVDFTCDDAVRQDDAIARSVLGLTEVIKKAVSEDRSRSITVDIPVRQQQPLDDLPTSELVVIASWYIWLQLRQSAKGETI
ncbi:putative carboxylesterase 2 [Triticum urartu]|uniref:Putative carboxylesterase 2 n=1 Tax=Triticum urartu TaxID=4572 RepID=M8A1F1_TRIUA|nr:putative carboxylesterase 2 [Triticum urartu]